MFTAHVVRNLLAQLVVKTLFIQRGSTWQNGYVKSFNGKLRDKLLDGEIFYKLREAEIMIVKWRRHYNKVRSHSSLGNKQPAPETIVTRPNTAVSRMPTQSMFEVGNCHVLWPKVLRQVTQPVNLRVWPTDHREGSHSTIINRSRRLGESVSTELGEVQLGINLILAEDSPVSKLLSFNQSIQQVLWQLYLRHGRFRKYLQILQLHF